VRLPCVGSEVLERRLYAKPAESSGPAHWFLMSCWLLAVADFCVFPGSSRLQDSRL
jgi:hypothetical protein